MPDVGDVRPTCTQAKPVATPGFQRKIHGAVRGHHVANAPGMAQVMAVVEIGNDLRVLSQPPVVENEDVFRVDIRRRGLFHDQRALDSALDLFASIGGYGSVPLPGGELFVLANYSLTPAGTPTVPEPATVLGLLSVAGVGLLCKGRKMEG